MPGDKSKPEDWTAEDKLAVVIETASINEVQLSEYCRGKGLYKEQIDQWKISALSRYQNSIQIKKNQEAERFRYWQFNEGHLKPLGHRH